MHAGFRPWPDPVSIPVLPLRNYIFICDVYLRLITDNSLSIHCLQSTTIRNKVLMLFYHRWSDCKITISSITTTINIRHLVITSLS